jgi:hypothetical protein
VSMGAEGSFHHQVDGLAPGIIRLELSGYLDSDSTANYLPKVEEYIRLKLRGDRRSAAHLLMVDSTTDFEVGRVAQLHAQWFKHLGGTLGRIAVVSTKTKVRFAATVVKLIIRNKLELFTNEENALKWLSALPPPQVPPQP